MSSGIPGIQNTPVTSQTAPTAPASEKKSRHAASKPAIARLKEVTKIYGKDTTQVVALNKVSVDFYEGEFTVIVGPSGSGKSTLLHSLAGLDTITSGSIEVAGQNLHQMKDKALTRFRRDQIGFVFQSFNLIPTITARANIELPLRLAHAKPDPAWFDSIIDALDLRDRLNHKPYQLSGGQQQRVAVARALMSRPSLLVADEPTGNLDSSSSQEVLSLLRDAVNKLGQTVIMVTHDRKAAAIGDRVIVVRDGQIVADLQHPSAAELSQVV